MGTSGFVGCAERREARAHELAAVELRERAEHVAATLEDRTRCRVVRSVKTFLAQRRFRIDAACDQIEPRENVTRRAVRIDPRDARTLEVVGGLVAAVRAHREHGVKRRVPLVHAERPRETIRVEAQIRQRRKPREVDRVALEQRKYFFVRERHARHDGATHFTPEPTE